MTGKGILGIAVSVALSVVFHTAFGQDALTKEADRLAKSSISQSVVKCGDTWFWKRIGGLGDHKVTQSRNLRLATQIKKISEADRLNGLEWSGSFIFSGSPSRKFIYDGKNPARGRWEEWQEVGHNNQSYSSVHLLVQKKNGKWKVDNMDIGVLTGEYGLEKLSCSDVQTLPK